MEGQTQLPELPDLPLAVLRLVVAWLLPADLFDDEVEPWKHSLRFSASSTQTLEPLGEALRDASLALAALRPHPEPASFCWPHAVRSIARGGCANCASWRALRPLRAVRPQTAATSPLHEAPQLSGASLCALRGGHLVIHGGRCSSSGETCDATYLAQTAQMPSGLVKWDLLRCQPPGPAARCYHAAAPVLQVGAGLGEAMLIFGGAGSGERLHGDTWFLELQSQEKAHGHRTSYVVGSGSGQLSGAVWRQTLVEISEGPAPRSSHVLAAWHCSSGGWSAVLHGGLGSSGVMADVWLLQQPSGPWHEMRTSGGNVARAHHCGAVCRDRLLVHSGQDETFLTVGTVHSLELCSGVWTRLGMPSLADGRPLLRIDAAAAAVGPLGLLVFGGVDQAFEFQPAEPWLLKASTRASAARFLQVRPRCGLKGPSPRACGSLCAAAGEGWKAYAFGGFDGQQDLSELWCLDMTPCGLAACR
mmetsp:Transcript_108956/g.318901  ORF Transcript_108956/g.318901 Transcript_108956/m.318901 type:complete len:474 (-) Transcript_108956:14-1435(-)